MALPGVYDLEIYRGDRFERIIRAREGIEVDGEITAGDPIDLTGCTAQAKIKDKKGVLLATFTCTVDPDQVTNTGEVNILLLPAETKLLTKGVYFWDFQIKQDEEHITTYLEGSVEVSGEITEDA